MYQTNDEETDATYQIGQKLSTFLDDEIILSEVLNHTAQQNEVLKNIEPTMLTDLSNCHTNNNSNQNLQSMTRLNDITHANTNKYSPNENLESIELRDLLKTWNLESLADHLIGETISKVNYEYQIIFTYYLFQERMFLYLF